MQYDKLIEDWFITMEKKTQLKVNRKGKNFIGKAEQKSIGGDHYKWDLI